MGILVFLFTFLVSLDKFRLALRPANTDRSITVLIGHGYCDYLGTRAKQLQGDNSKISPPAQYGCVAALRYNFRPLVALILLGLTSQFCDILLHVKTQKGMFLTEFSLDNVKIRQFQPEIVTISNKVQSQGDKATVLKRTDDTLGDWQKCHINRLSYYPMVFQYIKVHLGIPKTVILSNCQMIWRHIIREALQSQYSISTVIVTLFIPILDDRAVIAVIVVVSSKVLNSSYNVEITLKCMLLFADMQNFPQMQMKCMTFICISQICNPLSSKNCIADLSIVSTSNCKTGLISMCL